MLLNGELICNWQNIPIKLTKEKKTIYYKGNEMKNIILKK